MAKSSRNRAMSESHSGERSYPNLRSVLAPEYADLSDEDLAELLLEDIGEVDLENVEQLLRSARGYADALYDAIPDALTHSTDSLGIGEARGSRKRSGRSRGGAPTRRPVRAKTAPGRMGGVVRKGGRNTRPVRGPGSKTTIRRTPDRPLVKAKGKKKPIKKTPAAPTRDHRRAPIPMPWDPIDPEPMDPEPIRQRPSQPEPPEPAPAEPEPTSPTPSEPQDPYEPVDDPWSGNEPEPLDLGFEDPDPTLGSPAGQLLGVLSRPEVVEAISAMAIGRLGRQHIMIESTPVPVAAFATMLGELATRAAEAHNRFTDSYSESVPSYLMDDSGEFLCDVTSPSQRAAVLMERLREAEPRWTPRYGDAYGEYGDDDDYAYNDVDPDDADAWDDAADEDAFADMMDQIDLSFEEYEEDDFYYG